MEYYSYIFLVSIPIILVYIMIKLPKNLFSNDILKNVIWLFGEKIYYIILVFLGEGLISRTLGINAYGEWLYAVNFIIIVSSIALVAGSEVIVPALSKNKLLANKIITSAFVIRFTGALLSFFMINLYILFFMNNGELRIILSFLSFILILNEPFGVVVNYFQSIIRMKPIVYIRCFSLLMRTVFIYIAFLMHVNKYIYSARIIESATLAIFLVWLIKKIDFKIDFDYRVFKVLLSRGLSLWLPLISMMIYLRVDRFFVETYFSYATLAMYGVAVQFMEQAFLLLTIIVQSLSPRYIFPALSEELLEINVKKIITILLALVLLLQIGGWFLLPVIIDNIFGVHYFQSAQTAILLLPSLLFYAFDTVFMQVLYKKRKNKYVFLKWVIMMIVSCLLYYVWFGVFSQKNISVVFNVNYFIMMVVTYYFYNKSKKAI